MTERTKITAYYHRRPNGSLILLHKNKSSRAISLMQNAEKHLILDHYGTPEQPANLVEMYDEDTGYVYGVKVVHPTPADESLRMETVVERVGRDDIQREAEAMKRAKEEKA